MFILLNFGNDRHGFWNRKRFNYNTLIEAVEAGERTTENKYGAGYVVITQDNEMKVVYERLAGAVEVQVFPYICAKRADNRPIQFL